ncbi:MAG: CoB--CoM heterodisulfide reductase iron-sulfur subunit A family protein [Candidatus Cloacimonetes bacterium]|nr:CoB--CoM heterodisulfide reductase iron-sulfur subunit A family protein [Candidatus Cloacimonadota bacterium]
MKKIGVFVCHCGKNISSTVNIEKVVDEISKYPGVTYCEDYKYMCSSPGQQLVQKAILEHKLDGVVVSACSPTLHEQTFRNAAEISGMNPFMLEIANIREQCSWVHSDMKVATPKAISIIKTVVEKTKLNEALSPLKAEVIPKVLIIGAGIAGIQASLDIADAGHQVILLEKSPSIGGHMAQLSETFPTLDCSQCILTPKMVAVSQHKNIKLLTYSELEDLSGSIGNFKVKIKKKASYVDNEKCTGCGACTEKCPSKVISEFDEGLGKRKAIYTPFPQAVPNKPVLDKDHCIYFLKDGKCGICKITCTLDAIDFNQKDKIIEEEVGAIIVATGYELYPIKNMVEYGAGKYPDVVNGLQFERLLSASGPTNGNIRRPSDGKIPKRIVFLSCVGSRDPEHHQSYCSKICCMYMAKHALLYKENVKDGESIIFFIDVRTGGKDYEEFYTRAKQEGEILYVRGKPSRIIKEGDDLIVWSINTLTGKHLRINCDMVVLSMSMIPSKGIMALAKVLRIPTNDYGFLSEAHPKLRPVESIVPGFYLAGTVQGPKDIPEIVSQASAAAAKVLALFANDEISHSPVTAIVDEDICSGCGICIPVCPYDARELGGMQPKAKVNELLCEGCGICVAVCPSGASQQKNETDTQIGNMIEALL